MIRGIDLYQHVQKESTKHPNIEWLYDTVLPLNENQLVSSVQLSTGRTVMAEYIFNSILFNENELAPFGMQGYHLLQHFKGWVIEVAENVFNADSATFMDFRISQEQGTTFMYVLPVTPKKALIEFTLFTEKLLPAEAYINSLKEYIASVLNIKEYTIEHEEWGVIPMTNHRFPLQKGSIVQMGVAGGQVKGSSGYAFQFIQKRTAAIIDEIKNGSGNFHRRRFSDRKFHFFDSVLLRVLHHHLMPGDKIFAAIFKNNPPKRVFRFLDNETSLWEDLQIMRSVPLSIFLPASLKELFHLP
jgi:lycopene beta-cyclase